MTQHYCESLIDNFDLAPASWTEDDLRCQEPAVGKLHGKWLCEYHLDLAMTPDSLLLDDAPEAWYESQESSEE